MIVKISSFHFHTRSATTQTPMPSASVTKKYDHVKTKTAV